MTTILREESEQLKKESQKLCESVELLRQENGAAHEEIEGFTKGSDSLKDKLATSGFECRRQLAQVAERTEDPQRLQSKYDERAKQALIWEATFES